MPTCRSADQFEGRKFIFIHVPKTAGVSMTSALVEHVVPYENDLGLRNSIIDRSYETLGQYQGILFWHITMADLRAYYGDAEIDSYYSFAFIRNPWEWLVSMYAFIRGHRAHPESMICGHMSFKQFLRYFAAKKVTQRSFLAAGGRPSTSRIFRFEDMHQALDEIAAATGLRFDAFPVENRSTHAAYWEYYDREDVELVRRAFAEDISLGGYAFEGKIRIRYAGENSDLRRFIVDGTPRSGTTALMGALSMHPQCFCANERFQVFAEHTACLVPENLANCEIPPAFPEEGGIIEVNIDAFLGHSMTAPVAYPYLAETEQYDRLADRSLHAFGNKTPRYYFNALDICAGGAIKWIAIVRDPREIAHSWNVRAGDDGDAWKVDDAGLLGMMEYLQLCHALAQGSPENTFVVVYDHLFFRRWRQCISKLCAFLGLERDEQYLKDFKKYFVRSERGRKKPKVYGNEGEALFCQVSGAGAIHEAFREAGSGPLGTVLGKLRQQMDPVYGNLDAIVRQYFESCLFYPDPEALLDRILRDQSLFFARARFQGLFDPLAAPINAPHLKAWLCLILFYRRAFAAARHFRNALSDNHFSDPVRARFAAACTDMPYIFRTLDERKLSGIFAEGLETVDPQAIQKAASALEAAGLLEDAQILRYRGFSLARNESDRRAAACSFGAGEAIVRSRIGIGAGTWSSYLDMDGVRLGFP